MAVKMYNCGQSAGKTASKSLGYYLSGFADGEGSFNVSLIKRDDYRYGWKVSLSFNISQKDDTVPEIFKKFLNCGTIRYRKDGICYFETRKLEDIIKIVIPFFRNYPLLSENKKKVFEVFCKITDILKKKRHLKKTGMEEILKLRDLILVGRERKYSKKQILSSY